VAEASRLCVAAGESRQPKAYPRPDEGTAEAFVQSAVPSGPVRGAVDLTLKLWVLGRALCRPGSNPVHSASPLRVAERRARHSSGLSGGTPPEPAGVDARRLVRREA